MRMGIGCWMATVARDAHRRTFAVAASTAVHVVVLAALYWRLGCAPQAYETPTMRVELAPRWLLSERRRPETAPTAPTAAPTIPLKPAVSPPRPAQQPSDLGDVAPLIQPMAPTTDAPDVRSVLRRATGCDHAGFLALSPAERQTCLDRLAKDRGAASGSAQVRLDLDTYGRYARVPQDPILSRKPKNGCVARMKEEDVVAIGASKQEWVAGIGCALSF